VRSQYCSCCHANLHAPLYDNTLLCIAHRLNIEYHRYAVIFVFLSWWSWLGFLFVAYYDRVIEARVWHRFKFIRQNGLDFPVLAERWAAALGGLWTVQYHTWPSFFLGLRSHGQTAPASVSTCFSPPPPFFATTTFLAPLPVLSFVSFILSNGSFHFTNRVFF
jgi:hypothetical protein